LLVTVDVIERKQTRMFVSLKTERKQGYRLVAQVLSHKQQREQMLKDAYEDLKAFQKKYSTLSELSKVFTAITETLSKSAVA
jgi:ribosomal protein L3